MEVFGAKVEAQRRLTPMALGQATANTTTALTGRFGCPPGVKGVRITGLYLLATVVPSDADGTLVLNALVNDVSEGADDTVVSAADLETLIAAANRWYELTLAAETAEKQLTLEPGDSLRCTAVSDSAAIDANPALYMLVAWHPVPDYDDLERIKHPSEYTA